MWNELNRQAARLLRPVAAGKAPRVLYGVRYAVLGLSVLSAGCADTWLRESREVPLRRERPDAPVVGTAVVPAQPERPEATATRFYQTPKPPVREKASPRPSTAPAQASYPDREVSVALDAMPLPQFIDAVFGTILKRNISIDPQILQRKDIVSLKTGKPQSAASLFASAKAVLRSYGVTVQEFEGLVRFVPENGDSGYLPEIRRGRALPDVPDSVRPVFYFVELEHTNVAYASNWVKTAFGSKITTQDDIARNAVLLSGQSQNVAAAMQMLQVLDQPLMRGRMSVRIAPVFWSADDMSKRLNDILAAEGYFAGVIPTAPAPVILLPIPSINSLLVFSADQKLIDHILYWAKELDQPSRARGNGNYFTYPVRNADASDIAATIQQIMGGNTGTAAPVASGGTAAATHSAPRVVVNKATNSLIIQTTPTEYQQWYSLMRELDRPALSALVSVTVAEVQLDENEQFGFNWLVKEFQLNGTKINIGANLAASSSSTSTSGATTSSSGGLTLNVGSLPVFALTALASNSRARILSNPTILTRSGEDATISVGQDVPVITSQQSNASTNSANGGVLQTVQYRNTGVILKVRPVVHAGGRIDLDVSQEVSSAASTTTGVTTSPTISTRKLDTKLTVLDGNTVVMGGLMQDSRSDGGGGVPYAMDIPVLGGLFRSHNNTGKKTELVILITTYAIEDEFDANAIADAFKTRFPWTEPLYQKATKPRPGAGVAPGDQTEPAAPTRPTPDGAEDNGGSQFGAYVPQAIKTPTAAEPAPAPAPSEPADRAAEPPRAPGVVPDAGAAPKAPSPAAPGGTTSAPAATSPQPGVQPPGTVVTDEKLKAELLEAIRRSGH